MFVQWSYGEEIKEFMRVTSFNIETSTTQAFDSIQLFAKILDGNGHLQNTGIKTNYTYSITLPKPAYEQTVYVRISAVIVDDTNAIKLSNSAHFV